MLRKNILTCATLVGAMVVAGPALAESRLVEGQMEYGESVFSSGKGMALMALFFFGVLAVGFSAWFLLMDYVFAKSDHEKKFSLGKLLTGLVVGSLMVTPGAALMMGSDLTGANQADGFEVNADDFKANN